jgi:hypothetical protein
MYFQTKLQAHHRNPIVIHKIAYLCTGQPAGIKAQPGPNRLDW